MKILISNIEAAEIARGVIISNRLLRQFGPEVEIAGQISAPAPDPAPAPVRPNLTDAQIFAIHRETYYDSIYRDNLNERITHLRLLVHELSTPGRSLGLADAKKICEADYGIISTDLRYGYSFEECVNRAGR